jgi:hypothetical protein
MTDEEFLEEFDELTEVQEDENQSEETENTSLEETEVEETGNTLNDEPKNEDNVEVEENEEDTEAEPDEAVEETPEEVNEEDINKIKEFYTKVTSDFKANGELVKGIEDPEAIITALQKSANYEKKMSEIAPYRRRLDVVKDWNDEDLALLADIKNGDRNAITKLLKNNEIDPLDIDFDSTEEYTPKTVVPSEVEYAFTNAVEEISKSEHYDTINKVWEDWEDSRENFVEDPSMFKALEKEIQMGNYDIIAPIMRQEVALGKTTGETKLETYLRIKNDLMSKSVKSKKPSISDVERDSKRNAASITTNNKKAPQKQQASEKDFVKMSDEDFAKLWED